VSVRAALREAWAVRGALREAWAAVRAGRARAVPRALGTGLAAAMLALAATVGYDLHTGFARAARAAHLPDVIARFDGLPESEVAARVAALPDVAAYALREEVTRVPLAAGAHAASDGVVEVLGPGPRGYAVVAGRDVSGAQGGVVVEAGLARAWDLAPGAMLDVAGLGPQRVRGLARAPDNVAYPLAAPRVYLTRAALARDTTPTRPVPDPVVNEAEIWLRDPAELDAVLVQARTTAYGLHDLSILTRAGVRVVIDEAAGIVIALLAALSLVALLTATAMLAASARAEVQRRLRAIGVRRVLGAAPAHVAVVSALETALLAAPAAAAGVAAGALAGAGPADRLLALLNEAPPGAALALPLAGCFALAVSLPTALAAWPAWRAAGGSPVALLRGAELRRRQRGAPRRDVLLPRRRAGGGMVRLGARLAVARRVRAATTIAALAACAAFVLLMLALATELGALESDPAALGRRYQLTASLPAAAAPRVRALPGVQAVAPRYEVSALDSFSLGEVIDVIAYPGDQATFEDPPVLAGDGMPAYPGEDRVGGHPILAHPGGHPTADVGEGLAQVLGLGVGSTLALALPTGRELRVRVAGVVSSLQRDGRVAYVPAAALLAADPGAPEQLAVRVAPGASAAAVAARIDALTPARRAAAAPRGLASGGGSALVAALQALLRAVAAVDALVCVYTLGQALALTASERRVAIAVLRACGAGAGSLRALLAGAALAVAVPAAVAAVALERVVLGPALARLAAGYATLELGADAAEVALLGAGLALLAGAAVVWVAARATAGPVTRGLA
jgi:hypothetical protein